MPWTPFKVTLVFHGLGQIVQPKGTQLDLHLVLPTEKYCFNFLDNFRDLTILVYLSNRSLLERLPLFEKTQSLDINIIQDTEPLRKRHLLTRKIRCALAILTLMFQDSHYNYYQRPQSCNDCQPWRRNALIAFFFLMTGESKIKDAIDTWYRTVRKRCYPKT